MISKQKVTDFLSEGMRIAVTVVLKNKKEIEFVREDENDYKGFLSEYRYNQAALDKLFEKATDGQGILEGLKSINDSFMYWDLTDEEIEQLNEEFNFIHCIDDVTKIVIQEATVYDPGMGVDYEKYEYCYSSFNYTIADYKIENGILRKGPKKGDISIPVGTKEIAGQAFFSKEYGVSKGQLTSVTIPEGVTRIGSMAFCGQNRLKKVHFPSTVTSIDTYAFAECTSLSVIEGLPEDVIIGESAFRNCNSLANDDDLIIVNGVLFSFPTKRAACIDIPASVKRIDNFAFAGCDFIESVSFPDPMPKIGTGRACDSYAFLGCKGLADKDGFVIVDGCLYDYFGDKNDIRIPDGVRAIRGRRLGAMSGIWEKKDVSLTIPSSVVEYGEEAFAGVQSIRFEGDPPYTQGSLGLRGIVQNTFFRATSLDEGIVGAGAAAIASEIISSTTDLKKVTIADGVKKIGTPICEYGGGKIKDFYFPDSLEEVNGPLIDKKQCKRQLIIHATPGSFGEKYAEEYGYDFKPVKTSKK